MFSMVQIRIGNVNKSYFRQTEILRLNDLTRPSLIIGNLTFDDISFITFYYYINYFSIQNYLFTNPIF